MDYSYIGSGRIYLRKIGSTGGFIEVGNCDGVNINTTEQEITKPDRTQPGGGTFNEVRRIESCALQIIAAELSPENLARALYGATSAYEGEAITGESIAVGPGQYSPFSHLPASSPAPTIAPPASTTHATTDPVTLGEYIVPATPNGFLYKVTTAGTTGGSAPTFPTAIGETVTDGTAVLTCVSRATLVAGTDYDIRPGGIIVLDGRVVAGETWTAAYTSVDTDVVQALVTSGEEYEVVFDGLNEARSGKRTRLEAFRYKPGVAQAVGLLSDEYAALDVTGKLLKDTTKTGVGISQYFKADIER
ncbi:hypothetical protein [Methyloversatilis sp. XJ19-49]|uniref:phage tail tube protein n=1 Tax=Methyloversatilis sp. XJ19-49 TaxID=2963429 RepID=UPI00211C20E4|nr:hypothetical protein [Methyloversatilis sp. XJ19-49]MCQ9378801.1 hypothetical protein [Methyloversatilis sp. XJ19-49]